jgi:hypothetical protein
MLFHLGAIARTPVLCSKAFTHLECLTESTHQPADARTWIAQRSEWDDGSRAGARARRRRQGTKFVLAFKRLTKTAACVPFRFDILQLPVQAVKETATKPNR